jgi:hypothetical protein
VTSSWWWGLVAGSIGAPTLDKSGVAWVLAAGWVPWTFAAFMTVFLAARFADERQQHVAGAVGWSRASVILLALTGIAGALFSVMVLGLASLGLASLFDHLGGTQIGL